MDKADLFRVYNMTRKLARSGNFNTTEARVNRALGIAQSNKPSGYHTTPTHCSCPDAKNDRKIDGQWVDVLCKHQLAAIMREMAEHLGTPEDKKN